MNAIDRQISQAKNHIELFSRSTSTEFIEIYKKCAPYSNHSIEVMYSAYQSAKYVCEANIRGALIEFGVMNGGTLGCMGSALNLFGANRDLIGIDTFEGYPPPNSSEFDIHGNSMLDRYNHFQAKGEKWGGVEFDQVSKFTAELYPSTKLVKLEVNNSFDIRFLDLGSADITSIAYLRLDMNWYEPTLIALENCWDLIPNGGILSVVTGHHNGAAKALNHFFKKNKLCQNFINVNYSTVVCTKFSKV